MSNQGFSHAVGEIFLLRVAGKVLQWEYGDGFDARCRSFAQEFLASGADIQYGERSSKSNCTPSHKPQVDGGQETIFAARGGRPRSARQQSSQVHSQLFGRLVAVLLLLLHTLQDDSFQFRGHTRVQRPRCIWQLVQDGVC